VPEAQTSGFVLRGARFATVCMVAADRPYSSAAACQMCVNWGLVAALRNTPRYSGVVEYRFARVPAAPATRSASACRGHFVNPPRSARSNRAAGNKAALAFSGDSSAARRTRKCQAHFHVIRIHGVDALNCARHRHIGRGVIDRIPRFAKLGRRFGRELDESVERRPTR